MKVKNKKIGYRKGYKREFCEKDYQRKPALKRS